MKLHNPDAWARRDHYRWYRALDYPYLGITATVGVRGLLEDHDATGQSLFSGMLHRILAAANTVPELRQRIRCPEGSDQVVEHDVVHPGFTVAGAGDLFAFAAVDYDPDPTRFCAEVARASEVQQGNPRLTPFDDLRDDLLFCSCLPWLSFTHVTHPIDLGRADSIPRIAWGRITGAPQNPICPVNLQAHHALVDGIHVARFFERLEARCGSGAPTSTAGV